MSTCLCVMPAPKVTRTCGWMGTGGARTFILSKEKGADMPPKSGFGGGEKLDFHDVNAGTEGELETEGVKCVEAAVGVHVCESTVGLGSCRNFSVAGAGRIRGHAAPASDAGAGVPFEPGISILAPEMFRMSMITSPPTAQPAVPYPAPLTDGESPCVLQNLIVLQTILSGRNWLGWESHTR